MVSRPAPALIKVGFRRDVQLFLSILAGFFAMIVVALLTLLQTNVNDVRRLLVEREMSESDAATTELRRSIAADLDLPTQLVALRARYGFERIEVQTRGRTVSSGDPQPSLERIRKTVPGATITYFVDRSPADDAQRRFYLTAIICTVATAAGIALLLLYVPKILAPIDNMLEHAREVADAPERGDDEAQYLIQTFRNSIDLLKHQERELSRLHELEKTRADDLQMIVATLTRSLGSGFMAFDTDGRIVDINAAGREILELHTANATGQSISSLLEPSVVRDRLETAVRDRIRLTREELELSRRVIGLTTIPLVNAEERFLGTLALFTDLTQVRRLEARVGELQTLADLGTMSAAIAHEFRNSLSTILGLLRLAQRQDLPPDVSAKLGTAEVEAKELAQAVASLLQFARPMQLEIETVDLKALLEDLAQRLYASGQGPEIKIEGAGVIHGDSNLLARAFENLLRNAAEAAGEGAEAQVTVTVLGGSEPAVEIRDNGAGITEEETSRLFLPFHSTKPGGVGLGLPLARKIVLLHGGTIRFEKNAGSGTTVRVEFLDSGHALQTAAPFSGS